MRTRRLAGDSKNDGGKAEVDGVDEGADERRAVEEIELLRELVGWLVEDDGVTMTRSGVWFGERRMPERLVEALVRATGEHV